MFAFMSAAMLLGVMFGGDAMSAPAGLKAVADTPPILAIPRMAKAPNLDGHLAEGEWDGAATLATLIDSVNPAESFDYPRQQIRFAYDDDNLYMAIRCHFPAGAVLVKGEPRRSLSAADVEVWGTESFELYLQKPGDNQPTYRFGGGVGGHFVEGIDTDMAWNGDWTYRTSLGTTILSTDYWDVEVAVPFKTIGLEDPDGSELRMNIARTWCLNQLEATSWNGNPHYNDSTVFGTVRLSPDAVGYSIEAAQSPSRGHLGETFEFQNTSANDFEGTFEITLMAANRADDYLVQSSPISIESGGRQTIDVSAAVKNPNFTRVGYALRARGSDIPELEYSVPFVFSSEYLDIIPLNLQHKLVLKPEYKLYRERWAGEGQGTVDVSLEVFDSSGNQISQSDITSDDEVWIDLPEEGPFGHYRVSLLARTQGGQIADQQDRTFHRPATPTWMTERDDSMDRVLPPFTPLETRRTDDQLVIAAAAGREYRYRNGLLPGSIAAGGVRDLLAGAITIEVDGSDMPAGTLTVSKSSETRDELVAEAKSSKLTAINNFWIEYDGLIYNALELKAGQDVKTVALNIPIKTEHAQYLHMTRSGNWSNGGITRPMDASFSDGFWPIVWLGDFERGLCWFAETPDHMAFKTGQPLHIEKSDFRTVITIILAEDLVAGQAVTVKFGLLATPVRPFHPRYPLNIHASVAAMSARFAWYPSSTTPFGQPPGRTPDSALYNIEKTGFPFWDAEVYDKANQRWFHPGNDLADKNRRHHPLKVIPYMTPLIMSSEYPECRHYLREWELHSTFKHSAYTRDLPDGRTKPFVEYWMGPSSESYRRYYAWRIREMIPRTGIKGLYFDFGLAWRDSNRYHGAHGGLPLLAQRDFYRRIANEFVKAGIDDYVFVVHNTVSMQVPALTFITHFFNGEHHRVASGTTLHEGRDYLDTLPLYYFGIEHSGLPWGIHGNMLPELPEDQGQLKQIGVADETVSEYLWDRTSSIMMPILLHNCLPAGYQVSLFYYENVYGVLEDFDIPTARFHPYWRNQDLIEVDNPDFRVSFYSRPESPRLLMVVGNMSKDTGDVTIKTDLKRFYNWSTWYYGMRQLQKPDEILRAVERIGFRDARILDLGPYHVSVRVKGHSMALLEITGHQRAR